jgi:hypothetical protein
MPNDQPETPDYAILLCVHGGVKAQADRLAACVKAGLVEYVSIPQLTPAGKEALLEKYPEMREMGNDE